MEMPFKTVIYSSSTDPYMNLAIENELLLGLNSGESKLLIYRNSSSVVMGRFQNPWVECNLSELKKYNVHLVRRQSGGGCVYHDFGNLNFCFLHGDRDYKKAQNNDFLKKLLANFDIPAIVNDRSDVVFEKDGKPFKFSGSAFKQKKDRSFHHCTMLVNSELALLSRILNSPLKNLKTKSTPSNPVPVINLSEVNENLNIESIIAKLKDLSSDFQTVSSTLNQLEYYNTLKSRRWILGDTPLFECRMFIEDNLIDLQIKKAKIVEANSNSLKLKDLCENAVDLDLLDSESLRSKLAEIDSGKLFIENLENLHLI